jgi:DNA-binding response OmpR family regulator
MKMKKRKTKSLSGVGKLGVRIKAARHNITPSTPMNLNSFCLFLITESYFTPLAYTFALSRVFQGVLSLNKVRYSYMRVLIVEDEHKIANAIKQGLTQEKYAVDVEYDSDSGMAAALSEDYDLMIIDRMLPGSMEGLDICKKLRAEGNHTPILLLTAKGQVRDRVEGLNAGADDYLVKPFSFEELLARVRALLRRPQESKGNELKVHDLTLDTISYEVRRSGQPIELSAKEFALLEYMMRNSGQVLSKDRIISHVWDFDADILPNTVEVYMGYLRSKIDRPFADEPELIHTLRGFGYSLGRKEPR